MMLTRTRNVMVICSMVALCAALVGCSSSDDGKVADLERQLDMEKAARMTAEQAQANADSARTTAEQERDDAKAAQMTAEEAQAAAEAARMTAEQAVDDIRSAIVTNEIARVAAPGQPQRCALDTGCGSDSGVDYSSVSITHDIGYRDHGERLIHAIPWRGDDGQVEFIVRVVPEWLQRGNIDFFAITELRTTDGHHDAEGHTTSRSAIEDHGLGPQWQGVEGVKAYNDGGTLTVRFFTDLDDADNPLAPYTNYNAVVSEDEILLNDDRVPDLTGRDHLYFGIPEDGLKGTLDGVAGTFTCPEGYCSLLTYHENRCLTPLPG